MQRPEGIESVLRRIRNQLDTLAKPVNAMAVFSERCIGCGRFGVFLCDPCRELGDATWQRMRKLRNTIDIKFARIIL